MKKQLMTLAATLLLVGSVFGQGQVTFANNAGSLITVQSTGQPVAIGSTTFQLYYGAAGTAEANLLPLLPTAGTSAVLAGRIANTVLDVPLGPAAAATFQVWAWQSSFASYALAATGGGLVGKSALFNATTSAAGSPPPTPTSLAGLYPGFSMTGGVVPEPSTFALAGLGAAALLLFRRRK